MEEKEKVELRRSVTDPVRRKYYLPLLVPLAVAVFLGTVVAKLIATLIIYYISP